MSRPKKAPSAQNRAERVLNDAHGVAEAAEVAGVAGVAEAGAAVDFEPSVDVELASFGAQSLGVKRERDSKDNSTGVETKRQCT